ncbi:MAG: tetratricopeptide repeat protein [Chloroflexi bacterium]|nr:tetratricopeptide repeat protein [Chloroflexota bacterium]
MYTYFVRVGSHLVQASLRLPDEVIDRGLKVVITLTAIALVAFGGYYYRDRYASPVPTVQDQALRQLEAQVMQDPQNPEARVQVAWGYLDAGLIEQALTQFDEALKLREDYQAALIGKGNAYVRKGDLNAAQAPFELVAQLNENNPFKRTLRELQGVYYYLGTIYAQQGQDDRAIQAFTEALAIDSADADSLYGLGTAYLRQGDLEQARAALEQAVRLDPVFAEGYHALQTVYEQQGMVGHVLLARGMLSLSQGNYDEALKHLHQAVRTVPDLAEAHQALGIVYDRKGQQAEALDAFQSALERNPDLPLARGGVARLNR